VPDFRKVFTEKSILKGKIFRGSSCQIFFRLALGREAQLKKNAYIIKGESKF
jgi:hypothetical protein